MPTVGQTSASHTTHFAPGSAVDNPADAPPISNNVGFNPLPPDAQVHGSASGAALDLSPSGNGANVLAFPRSPVGGASQNKSWAAFARDTLSTFWAMFKGEGMEAGEASRRYVLAQRSNALALKLSDARAANNKRQIRELTRALVDVEYEAATYATSKEDKLKHLEKCIETYFDTYGMSGGDHAKRMLEIVYLAHGLYFERATGVRAVRTTGAHNNLSFVLRGQRKPPEEVDMLAYFRSRSMLVLAAGYLRSTDSRYRLDEHDNAQLWNVYPPPEQTKLPMGQDVTRNDLTSWDLLGVMEADTPMDDWKIYDRWDNSGLLPFIKTVFQAGWNRAAEARVQESLPEMPTDLVKMTIDKLEASEASEPESAAPALDDPAA